MLVCGRFLQPIARRCSCPARLVDIEQPDRYIVVLAQRLQIWRTMVITSAFIIAVQAGLYLKIWFTTDIGLRILPEGS